MVFVFKDYFRKVATVNSIPMNMLDHVKEWLKYVVCLFLFVLDDHFVNVFCFCI